MAKSENQKLKTLYVAKYLLEYSDENHPVTASDIIDHLEDEYDIFTERRSIYRDIAILRDEFGMDIVGGQGGKYRLVSRQFEFDDLMLLAECVHAAKFISAAKAKDLVRTISEFCSTYQADQLQNEVFLVDRVKTTQKGILGAISTIRAAMSKTNDGIPHQPQKISFKYMKYSIDDFKSQVARRRGKSYIVSPFQLLINDGNYYLIAYSDADKAIRVYRVDRMKDVRLYDAPREGGKEFSEIDIATYTQRVFSMYKGQRKHVSMRFITPLLDTVIERFGTDSNTFYMPVDKDHFTIITDVDVSPQFYAWILGFGKRAKITSPPEVVEGFKEYIASIAAIYE